MVGVGRDLSGSSSPTPLPQQGHLQQAAQDRVQGGLEYLQQRPLWPWALREYGASWPKTRYEPLLFKLKNRQERDPKDTKGYSNLRCTYQKMELLEKPFSHSCAGSLWDVLVLSMEKGHLFLGPSARDVLWAQDLSNRITRPISFSICLYPDRTRKGKSVL